MKSSYLNWGVVLLLSGFPAVASHVLKLGSNPKLVSVSQDQGPGAWHQGEPVCISPQRELPVCGRVVKVTSQLAIVELDSPGYSLSRGDKVQKEHSIAKATNPISRKPASTNQNNYSSSMSRDEERLKFHCLTGGFSVGNGFYFPLGHFQRLIDSEVAIGLMPTYFTTSSTTGALSAFGVLGSINYYDQGFFKGLWAQAATGAYFFSSTVGNISEQQTSLSVLGTIGWRANWDLGMNIGVALGAQYIADPAFRTVSLNQSPVRILALFDIGITF